MQFEANRLYHIYNQGNNKQLLFYSRGNYLYFLKLYKKFVSNHGDLLAYCLMPNHFHFLINTNENSIRPKNVGSLQLTELSNGIRMLLSSYSSAINKQENMTGSLFRQKTQAKLLENESENYPFICFRYIHQNPMKAGLVGKLEDWEFSSFAEYHNKNIHAKCNHELARKLIGIKSETFIEESYSVIDSDKIRKMYL